MGKDQEHLPEGKGTRRRHLSNVGVLNYLPHLKVRGSPALGKGAASSGNQWSL